MINCIYFAKTEELSKLTGDEPCRVEGKWL